MSQPRYEPLAGRNAFRVPLNKTDRAQRSMIAWDLGERRLGGPAYMYPSDYDENPSAPWYVGTMSLRRTAGGRKDDREAIRIYEVSNIGTWHRKLPVLRHAVWHRHADVEAATGAGVFNPRQLEESVFRITRTEASNIDRMCQAFLDQYRKQRWEHATIIIASHKPKVMHIRPRSLTEIFGYHGDGVVTDWMTGDSRALDRRFAELWNYVRQLCAAGRQLHGWTDGYEVPPDAYARLWAKELNRSKRRK